MQAPRTRLLGLEAPRYAPYLLQIKVDFRAVVEEPLGYSLDVASKVVLAL
jgi:hypothetical protein